MSQITIQCRLVSSELTRHQLWKLMAQKNTPLINELLAQVGQHPDFETWQQKGEIPAGTVKQLCESVKTDPCFIGQPGRFYTSAIDLVDYIYKSWLSLHKRLQNQLVCRPIAGGIDYFSGSDLPSWQYCSAQTRRYAGAS